MNIKYTVFILLLFSFTQHKHQDSVYNRKNYEKNVAEFAYGVFKWLNSGSNNTHRQGYVYEMYSKIKKNKYAVGDIRGFIAKLKELGKENPNERDKIPGSYYATLALLTELEILQKKKISEDYDKQCKAISAYWGAIYNLKQPLGEDYVRLEPFEKKLSFSIKEFDVWVKSQKEKMNASCGLSSKKTLTSISSLIRDSNSLGTSDSKKRRKIYRKKIGKVLAKSFSLYRKTEPDVLDRNDSLAIDRYREELENIKDLGEKLARQEYWFEDHYLTSSAYKVNRAMLLEIKTRLDFTNDDCSKAHRAWYEALVGWDIREMEIMSSYSIHHYGREDLTKEWIALRHDYTKDCANPIYSLCADTTSIYPDERALASARANKAEIIPKNQNCIYKGCMNKNAMNFNPEATIPDTCIFVRCLDGCYFNGNKYLIGESYTIERQGKNKVIASDSLCRLSRRICGCINPCSTNYDASKGYLIDDGSCDEEACGCLDESAVNYAGDSASVYYDPLVVTNFPDECSWKGILDRCLDPEEYDNPRYRHSFAKISDQKRDTICGCLDNLARNYNFNATHHDTTACKYLSIRDIEGRIRTIDIEINNYAKTPNELKKRLNELYKKKKKKTKLLKSSVKFISYNDDNGLEVDVDIDFSKIKNKDKSSSSLNFKQDGIPLGRYYHKPVNDIIRSVMVFLGDQAPQTSKNISFRNSKMSGRIVGEADGVPIRPNGIQYLNKSQSKNVIHQSYCKKINVGESIDVDTIECIQGEVYLENEDFFNRNEVLAFLRAFLVRQQIGNFHNNVENITIYAIENEREGDKYRKISAKLLFHDYFFEINERIFELEEERERYKRMKEAIKKGTNFGKIIDECLCPL